MLPATHGWRSVPMARKRIVVASGKVHALASKEEDQECPCALLKWNNAMVRLPAGPVTRGWGSVPMECVGTSAA